MRCQCGYTLVNGRCPIPCGNEYDAGAMAWETVEEMLMFLAQFDWRGRS